jgi:hypothetical protein
MSMKIAVEHLQRGQPRPYGPHTYEAKITIEGAQRWDCLLEGQMKDLIRACVHPFTEEPSDGSMDSHFRPRLKRLECTEDVALTDNTLGPRRQVWMVRVEEPFCD